MTISLPKMAEPIEILFGMWTWVGPRNHVLDGGPDIPQYGTFDGMTSGFSHMPPSTVPSGSDVGISTHDPTGISIIYHIAVLHT